MGLGNDGEVSSKVGAFSATADGNVRQQKSVCDMPKKKTPQKKGGVTTPSPQKKGGKSPSSRASTPRGPPVHAAVKATTRYFREFVAAIRRWIATEDEAKDVFASLERFAARIPVIERCKWDDRKLGVLRDDTDGLAGALAAEHGLEVQRLARHVRAVTLGELVKAVDDMHADPASSKVRRGRERRRQKCVEDAHALLGREGWDPATPAGACPMAPLELLTWMGQLSAMFVDELWRKEVLAENVLRAVWASDDDDKAAATARDAARLWPRQSSEAFVDDAFLEIVLVNHDTIL